LNKVVFYFKADLHEVLKNGSCSGKPIASSGNLISGVDFENKEEAEIFLKFLTEEAKKLCQPKQSKH
jgi:hypothetical protein